MLINDSDGAVPNNNNNNNKFVMALASFRKAMSLASEQRRIDALAERLHQVRQQITVALLALLLYVSFSLFLSLSLSPRCVSPCLGDYC